MMGREIREVPLGWEHPRDERSGRYIPMHDRTWKEAFDEWYAEYQAWEADKDGERSRIEAKYGRQYAYPEWNGDPPGFEDYRPAYPEGAVMGFQVYETVTEGTPVSPVFETKAALQEWLAAEGYSPSAAAEFVQSGWAPSMAVSFEPGASVVIRMDIESLGSDESE